MRQSTRDLVDDRLAKKEFKVGRDSDELDHLANLLLEGSYTKTVGILAPIDNSVKAGRRLRIDTFDPRIGMRREIPFTDFAVDDGDIDVYADGNGNQYLVINHDDPS